MTGNHFHDVSQTADAPAEHSALALLSTVTGTFVVALGLLVIIGWANDVEVLKRVRPGWTEMNPLTALNLILSGVAILLARGGRWRGTLAVGSFIFLVALAKAADIAWGGLPVDQLLFAKQLDEGISLPNAMAPNTAVAFFLVALALILAASQRRSFSLISQGLGASVLAISLFALIGYAFGINPLNTVGPFIPMALHTGFGLVMVSLGLLSLTPHRGLMLVLRDAGPAGSMARIVLPLAILVPVAVGAMRLWGQSHGYYGTEVGVALQVVANVLVTSTLLISSVFALQRSDSMRRRREQDLTRSEARYRLAEQVAQVGHWRIDLPSRQVSWSDEIFRISGISMEDGVLSAADVLAIYHPDDRRLVRQSTREALREGRDWEYLVRLCRPDGEVRHVSSHGVCERDKSGRLTGLFGVFADVTDLEQARRMAEAAVLAKSSFLANMSHEIRTPMNGVIGFTDLLLSGELTPEQRRQAELIAESGRAMMRLLNDILDLSKVEAGQMQIASEFFDLHHALKGCGKLVAPALEQKHLKLSVEVADTLPRTILGDGLRLRQIVLNLLGNAAKFTAAGGVDLVARAEMRGADEQVLVIDVTDTGIGIPRERQDAIFEAFVQTDATISHRFGGTGLGLSISVHLAKLMGGTLTLVSLPGKGSCFTLTLPLIPCDQCAEAGTRTASGSDDWPDPCEAYKVLVAEDHDINQMLITAILSRLGCTVTIAPDGTQAVALVEAARAGGTPYDLVLMDTQMPVLDGPGAARQIRAAGITASELPIVALTANAYADDVAISLSAGMQAHIAKPVTLAQLKNVLRQWGNVQTSTEPTMPVVPAGGSIQDRYCVRRDEALAAVDELVRRGVFEAEELQSVADQLHKLAGTAAMFGEIALGEQARALEVGLEEWTAEERVQRITNAARGLRDAA